MTRHIATERPRTRRQSPFLRLWLSSASSGLADGVYLIALPLIALTLTTSPVLIAGVRVAQTFAGLLVGLVVGVLVDRYDRRRLIVIANLVRTAALAGLGVAALLDGLSLTLVFTAAFAVGIAETISDTAAQALVPMVVEKPGLRRANGWIQGAQTVTNDFIGAPLGALLFGLASLAAVLAPATLYLLAALVLTTLAGRYVPTGRPTGPGTIRQDVREGLTVLWRQATLRRIALYGAISNFTNMAFFAVFIVFAVGASSTLRLSSLRYSLLLTAAAVGAVLGATLADRVCQRLSPRTVGTAVILALAVCFGTPVCTGEPALIGIALALSGFVTSIGSIMTVSLRQTLVPGHLLGRVAAGSRLISLAARPIGALAGGLTAAALTERWLFAIVALVVVAALPLTLQLPDRQV